MKQKEFTINALNQLLQGEYMAVDSIDNLMPKVVAEEIKQELQKLQNYHRDNIRTLANYIQDLGGRPKENLGFKGTMADTKMDLELGAKPGDDRILETIVKGETGGINMAEKVLRGKLDDRSRDLAGEVLHEDRIHLEQFRRQTHLH